MKSMQKESISHGVVQSYLLGHNFTKNSIDVRPPTYGEEHDVGSVSGKSSHSSVSGKSEVSTATPRRTDMDLGYEPEGSASPLPAHERWKLSLYNMLHDGEGITAFKRFLAGSNQENLLECWLAMKGFREPRGSGNSSAASSTTGTITSKTVEQNTSTRIKLAKIICKTFLQSDSPKYVPIVKTATKQYIRNQIKTAVQASKDIQELDCDLFHQAQTEIEHNVEAHSYKQFLSSSEFSAYAAQSDSASQKLSSHLNGQPNGSHPNKEATEPSAEVVAGKPVTTQSIRYLSPLDEHEIWSPCSNSSGRTSFHPSGCMPLTHESLAKTAISRVKANHPAAYAHYPARRSHEMSDAHPYFTPGRPYFVPPASAIGSDQASKSSDATSDTLSYTDNSSVDGIPSYGSSRQAQKRLVRCHIKKNPCDALPECREHVPRTSRMKDEPNLLSTNDPKAFFNLLRPKLQHLADEQKAEEKKWHLLQRSRPVPVTTSAAPLPVGPSIKDDEDEDQILDNHLERVMHSPGGRYSPVMNNQRFARQAPTVAHNPPYKQQKQINHQKSINIGVVPGMPRNEVPDIHTPVIPVDKTQMISAWIQTPTTKNKKSLKKRRSDGPLLETEIDGVPYLHPAESTGLQSGGSKKRLQPLAQDPTMPLFDQPDAGTTIEEVKRRLMEETDMSYNMSHLENLQIGGPVLTSLPPDTSSSSTTSSALKTEHALHPNDHSSSRTRESCTDSDSSSETATLSNVNTGSESQQKKPQSTTVVYYMPHEPVPYRVRLPHSPLTLGQFKNSLSKKGSYKYFFKQFSVELKRPVYFQVSIDSETLPLWEGYVLAKIDPCPA